MLIRSDPFREIDRWLENVSTAGRERSIPMDAYRQADDLVLHFDMPGVDPDAIELSVENDVLRITGSRRWEAAEDQELLGQVADAYDTDGRDPPPHTESDIARSPHHAGPEMNQRPLHRPDHTRTQPPSHTPPTGTQHDSMTDITATTSGGHLGLNTIVGYEREVGQCPVRCK